MKRQLAPELQRDLPKKIVILTGPRQCGKTTLSRSLEPHHVYLNYDNAEDRQILSKKTWDTLAPLVIFDELHKMNKWKQWLKGQYDTLSPYQPMLVTCSARMDTYRKAGDSLAGRFFQFRLHPLDLEEINQFWDLPEAYRRAPVPLTFERFWECGPFPDPFLHGDPTYYRRWRTSNLDIVLRQDLQDLSAVRDIQQMETLVALLRERAGSPISVLGLARDLQKDPSTIRKWLELLESLYVIFKVTPYHHNIARAILKEPKYYFFDFCQVSHSDGAKFENLVACALFKKLQYIEDTQGYRMRLHYVRTRDGKELDFLIVKEGVPQCLIEAKWRDDKPSPNFKTLAPFFEKSTGHIQQIQLVRHLSKSQVWSSGVRLEPAPEWLTHGIGTDTVWG
jgi:uncharacterized protein